MADWLGRASWLLQLLVDRIADHVMASVKLHADDTPVPMLAPAQVAALGEAQETFIVGAIKGDVETAASPCSCGARGSGVTL